MHDRGERRAGRAESNSRDATDAQASIARAVADEGEAVVGAAEFAFEGEAFVVLSYPAPKAARQRAGRYARARAAGAEPARAATARRRRRRRPRRS